MSFLSPWSLLMFLPLGAIITLLYLLKLKRKEQVISSVFLWREAVADIQANAPFQKLRKNLLLILQLGALFLLTAALARPFVRAQGIGEHKVIVILDCSASMQSTDTRPSRFEMARRRALDIAERMGPGDKMLVIAAGSKARVVSGFSSDKKALAYAIRKLKPTDAPCNMRRALLLASSLAAGRSARPPRIVVLSDGGFPDVTDLPMCEMSFDYIKIGSRCDNVGIVGLDARKTLSGEQQVFISLKNFSSRERRFSLEIYLDDQLIDVSEQVLRPRQTKQQILTSLRTAKGRLTVKLDLNDDLAADNSGTLYLTGRRDISVLVVSKGNIFLQNALSLDPRTQLTLTKECPSDLEKRGFDLVVFDCVRPLATLPPGGYLLINTSFPGAPAKRTTVVASPKIIDSERHHPVTAHVDFSPVRIARATLLKPKLWAQTLAETSSGPLIVAGEKDGRRFVQLGFDLLESDFPLHVGFPIFMTNCLEWLAPSESVGDCSATHTGEPAYINVPPSLDELTVVDPDETKRKIKIRQTPVAYEYTDRTGVYRVLGRNFYREFACNLVSTTESDTRPRSSIRISKTKWVSAAHFGSIRTNRELYGSAVLLALALLVFEWYAYHRRL
ncbi:MAG: VWA domain-containing protein [Armatimonadota bacterium]|nr:VWA domain-containing protein [Armatimonadota bacterium]